MKSNYYDDLLIKIDNLILESKLDQALSIINDELSIPYVPSDFLKKIETRKKDIERKINFDKAPDKKDFNQLIVELNSNNKEDIISSMFTIMEVDFEPQYFPFFEMFLNNSKVPIAYRGIFFHSMIARNVNHDFTVGKIVVNPSSKISQESLVSFINCEKQIKNRLFKLPSQLNMSISMLVYYFATIALSNISIQSENNVCDSIVNYVNSIIESNSIEKNDIINLLEKTMQEIKAFV
jgi:hypothetical protein